MVSSSASSSGDKDDDRDHDLDVLPVPKPWRFALGLLGLALLAVSCYAVLTADNELGTTALAVIGAFVLTISALGQWPARLAWGDKIAEWGARRVQRAVTSGADRQEVAQVAARVARTPLEHLLAFQLQSESRAGNRFEAETIERLGETAQIIGCNLIPPDPDSVWDARLSRSEGRHPRDIPLKDSVVVLCSRHRRTGGGKTLTLMARLQAISMRGDVPAAVLVITEYDSDQEDADYLAETFGSDQRVPVFVTKLGSPEFNEIVRRAGAALRS